MSGPAVLRVVAATLLTAAALTAPLGAQAALRLEPAPDAPRVTVTEALDDDALESVVRSGLPLRMRFTVELWQDEVFDDLVAQTEWSAVVAFEPLEGRYLAGLVEDDSLAAYPSWVAVRESLERVYRPGIRPERSGTYYYIATLEIETLSLSDLDELEQWLRGELEPAVRGRRSVGGAVGTGLKRLLIRILGLPARRYEARSDPFRMP